MHEARALEVNDTQASGIESTGNVLAVGASADKKRRLKDKQTTDQGRTCFQCNGSWPHGGICAAKNKTCKKCGQFGHFVKMCHSSGKINAQANRNRAVNHIYSETEVEKKTLFMQNFYM